MYSIATSPGPWHAVLCWACCWDGRRTAARYNALRAARRQNAALRAQQAWQNSACATARLVRAPHHSAAPRAALCATRCGAHAAWRQAVLERQAGRRQARAHLTTARLTRGAPESSSKTAWRGWTLLSAVRYLSALAPDGCYLTVLRIWRLRVRRLRIAGQTPGRARHIRRSAAWRLYSPACYFLLCLPAFHHCWLPCHLSIALFTAVPGRRV